MASGALTSAGLTAAYIHRIESLNPTLHAVIEVNPNALAIATSLDNERRAGQVRGPLHGIPILVKDNIATNDNMQTTAGSLAIYGSQVPADAPLIQKLRAAGAIILGKANLGEWANFRDDEAETYPLAVGWSARGGSTNNAYDLSYTSWGSSSGSGAGAASNLCAAAVGTETDGSITGPSAVENIFGLKPTLGLISQDGIVPNDLNYIAARNHATSTTRAGIDNAMTSQNLDAIVAPHLTNSTGPAVAGYPNFSMPVGIRSSGRPAGMLMYSTAFHEAQLIAMAYDLEQALNARQQPQLLGAIQPIPNGGFCSGHQPQGKPHLPHGRFF
jgi:amidase